MEKTKILLAALIMFFTSSLIAFESYEKLTPTGWINDFAGILNEQTKQELNNTVAELKKTTTNELAIVTVQSLEGETVEFFTNKLFNKWGVGTKGKDNGVMILVAVKERKIRIETGYGVESILPDGLCGEIIRKKIAPYFKAGDFSGGVLEGTRAVVLILNGKQPDFARGNRANNKKIEPTGIIFFFIIIFLFFVLPIIMSFFPSNKRFKKRRWWHYTGGGFGGHHGGFSGGGGGFGGFGGGRSGGGGASGGW